MNPVKLRLPPGSETYNFLYRTRNPEYLVQDVLSVSLPNGFCIDVGWFPEHDPAGHYCIRVFQEHPDAQKIPPIESRNLDDVIQTVESLAARFNAPAVFTSSSSESCLHQVECAG